MIGLYLTKPFHASAIFPFKNKKNRISKCSPFFFFFFFFLYPHFFFDIEREKSLPQHVKQCAGEIKLCYSNMLSDTKFI